MGNVVAGVGAAISVVALLVVAIVLGHEHVISPIGAALLAGLGGLVAVVLILTWSIRSQLRTKGRTLRDQWEIKKQLDRDRRGR